MITLSVFYKLSSLLPALIIINKHWKTELSKIHCSEDLKPGIQ